MQLRLSGGLKCESVCLGGLITQCNVKEFAPWDKPTESYHRLCSSSNLTLSPTKLCPDETKVHSKLNILRGTLCLPDDGRSFKHPINVSWNKTWSLETHYTLAFSTFVDTFDNSRITSGFTWDTNGGFLDQSPENAGLPFVRWLENKLRVFLCGSWFADVVVMKVAAIL